MTTLDVPTTARVDRPQLREVLRRLNVLTGAYLGLSIAALAVATLLRNHPAEVNSAVWTRGSIAAVSALLIALFAVRTARGARRAYLRLRIVSAISVAGFALVLALPGFPLWMKVEQGVCGLLLLGVVALVNGRDLRAAFAR
jgi:uncharacterized protein (DUF983 family)